MARPKKALKITPAMRAAVLAELRVKGGQRSRANMPAEKAIAMNMKAAQARWARWRAANGRPAKEGDEEFL